VSIVGTASGTDSRRFRNVLSPVPTAVVVVAAQTAAGPAGLAAASFVSISLDPPLIGIFVAETSASWPKIEEAGSFAVSVLAEDQKDMCARFARSGNNKFAGLSCRTSSLGHPVLPGTVASLDCTIAWTQPIGDHRLVVGHVADLAAAELPPLVFCGGQLGGLARTTAAPHWHQLIPS
jgi:3-hydroxy-9,10-secoandrosta-1,3,5(10)-triene-9,17-dione monooxygenase reductase component